MRGKTTLKVAKRAEPVEAPAAPEDVTPTAPDLPVYDFTTRGKTTFKVAKGAEPVEAPATPEDVTPTAHTTPMRVDKPRRKKMRRPVHSDTIPAIPVATFRRITRAMAENYRSDLRWEAEALEALQVGAEAFMVEKFQKGQETSDLFKRKTMGSEMLHV